LNCPAPSSAHLVRGEAVWGSILSRTRCSSGRLLSNMLVRRTRHCCRRLSRFLRLAGSSGHSRHWRREGSGPGRSTVSRPGSRLSPRPAKPHSTGDNRIWLAGLLEGFDASKVGNRSGCCSRGGSGWSKRAWVSAVFNHWEGGRVAGVLSCYPRSPTILRSSRA
jgi:hypothetical protein